MRIGICKLNLCIPLKSLSTDLTKARQQQSIVCNVVSIKGFFLFYNILQKPFEETIERKEKTHAEEVEKFFVRC